MVGRPQGCQELAAEAAAVHPGVALHRPRQEVRQEEAFQEVRRRAEPPWLRPLGFELSAVFVSRRVSAGR
jgi:hypothetical protein